MANLSLNNPNWQSDFPEYELEGLWFCEIEDITVSTINKTFNDGKNNITLGKNNIRVGDYLRNGFDKYVESVNIPQLNLNIKNTEYGLFKFEDKSAYESYTVSFYDDIRGSCLGFFTDWMKLIFDEELHCLQPNWRYEAKNVILTYYRTLGINQNSEYYRNEVFPIATYRMIKSLPINISDISADEDGGDRKSFSVTLLPQRVKTSTMYSTNSNDMYYDSSNAVEFIPSTKIKKENYENIRWTV